MALSMRLPVDLVDWMDQDLERLGKADRRQYVQDLLQALRDGRVIMAPARRTIPGAAPTASQRVRREYSKADQASGRGGRPA